MDLIVPLEQVRPEDRGRVGGKCFALAVLAAAGFRVPDTICVPAEVYDDFVSSNGLRERILLELHRKNFAEMRWEEIWDASLRIRNMFLTAAMPEALAEPLERQIRERFGERPLAVRSSAPGEDSAKASFAGLHESYVNVRGGRAVLNHIRKVWASLWSDAALLYRRELALAVETSTMAALVQETIAGSRSGVAFGADPTEPSRVVIEAVYGLNQGLVDGTVEPDRWFLDRRTGEVLRHAAPGARTHRMVPAAQGVQLEPLPAEFSEMPPLTAGEVTEIFRTLERLESLFGQPQDLEWTLEGSQSGPSRLVILQSRPVTAARAKQDGDQRGWYLSLRRSLHNLKELRKRIEGCLIPQMIEEAEALRCTDLESLADDRLAAEIRRRADIFERWKSVYWSEFIPFAHGARLLGQVYNDAVRPSDPYAFLDLLQDTGMVSIARNERLEDLADLLRLDPDLARRVRDKGAAASLPAEFAKGLEDFLHRFGMLQQAAASAQEQKEAVFKILLKMAGRQRQERKARVSHDPKQLEEVFLKKFEGGRKEEALELLDLARASYRLRDDDNIHLGRIERELRAAVEIARKRIAQRRGVEATRRLSAEEVAACLLDPARPIAEPEDGSRDVEHEAEDRVFKLRARQLRGQPAGPGLSRGRARVIRRHEDLLSFRSGEILVCDAVDPTMTFVVPLASGIVERRGGMLIHGAIIAREYGLACVTGVLKATTLIRTGDTVTVDGYLGIVILGPRAGGAASS